MNIWINSLESPIHAWQSGLESKITIASRVRRHLTMLLHGNAHGTYIRGAGVAVNRLFNALTENCPGNTWTLNVPEEMIGRVSRDLNEYSKEGRCNLHVEALPGTCKDITDASTPQIWLDLTALSLARSLTIRNWHMKYAYPVIALMHTLSVPTLLEDILVPVIVNQSFSYDRLICPTRSSAVALNRLIEYQQERISLRYGTRKAYKGKIEVVSLPVNTTIYLPGSKEQARNKLGLDTKAIVLLYVGFIGMDKADLLPVLDVVQTILLRCRDKKIVFCIVGTAEKEYLSALKRQVQERRLVRNVYVETSVSEDDKVLFYQSADIFMSPSDTVQESFGLTVVEAMACGIPQLVSDWNGYRELVVHGETGFCVKTKWAACTEEYAIPTKLAVWGRDHVGLGQSVSIDMDEWCYYLQALIEDGELRCKMGDQSRRRAVEQFSDIRVARNHQEIWKGVSEECKSSTEKNEEGVELCVPDYFRCFGHYASEVITGKDIMVLNKTKRPLISKVVRDYHVLPAMESLLEKEVLNLIVRELESQDGTLEGIVARIASPQKERSKITRHVMWLLKHGFIRLKQADSVNI